MKNNIRRRWIYLPIEVKARELIPKLFLGAKAVRAGFGIFLGRNGMNVSRDKFPRGIYFDKCLSKHKIKFHEYQVNTLGNRLVSFDEEGLLYDDESELIRNRISQRSVDLSDLIFTWGEEQARLFRTNYSVKSKIVISGGPRLDIWRPEFASLYQTQISQIQEKYGKYILVVSNWGYDCEEKKNGVDPHKIYSGNLLSHIRSAFITSITELSSALPNQTLIVRPHPQDLPEYWEKVAKTFPQNVKVINDGPISPWVHAAHAVIHNDCTTGLEGWIGNASVFAYYPIFQEYKEYSRYIMPINELSVVCRTTKDLISKISATLSTPKAVNNTSLPEIAQKFIHIENERYASDCIIKKLQELNIPEENYEATKFNCFKKLRAFWGSLKWVTRDYLGKSGMYTRSYTRQKNPGLEINEITELLKRVAPLAGIDDTFFQVKEVDKDTFCIFGKQSIEQHK